MHLDVRARIRGEKINRSILEAGEKLFGKLGDFLPDAAMIDVTLENLMHHKKGRTHYTHASLVIPGEPRTFHAESLADDFRTGLDRTYARVSQFAHRWHAKSVKLARKKDRAAKASMRSWLHATLSKPSRFFAKFRKHDPQIPEA